MNSDRLPPETTGLQRQQFSQSVSLNPLDMFPTKNDTIRRTFVLEAKDSNRSKRFIKDGTILSSSSSLDDAAANQKQWLFPDKITNSSFGIQGKSNKEELTRSFRRLASSTIFVSPLKKDTPLGALHPPNNPPKNYVIVEESRLQELILLDESLRRERKLLGEQCSVVFSDYQFSVRIPLPATRLAVHTFCEQQMTRVHGEIVKLQQAWNNFSLQNHYNKPHLFLKESYVKNAPVSQRALKLRLVREATDTWQLRKERDTMLYEDDMSFLTCLYYDAQIRQRDYERYFILANRYGAFSEQEFQLDSRPGRRYYAKVTKGAIKLQLLWDRYWAVAKLRRYRSARKIQKHFRGYRVYKRLHPIILMRLKIGKKTYFIFCMARWKEYVGICLRVKRYYFVKASLANFVKLCFSSWRNDVLEEKASRLLRIKHLMTRALNASVNHTLMRWKQFIRDRKQLKIRLRRLFGFPQFDLWLEYVKECKYDKKVRKSIVKLQATIRMFICVRKFLHKKQAKHILFRFSAIVLAHRRVNIIREATLRKAFEEWAPDEKKRRENRANDMEKQRLQKKQLYIQDNNKTALKDLQSHLSTSDGNLQLNVRGQRLLSKQLRSNVHLFGLSNAERFKIYDTIANEMKEECYACIKLLAGHNFEAKFSPFLRCPNPQCNCTFTAELQFHNHFSASSVHQAEVDSLPQNKQYTHFYIILKHPKGQEMVRLFLLKRYGLSGAINAIDAWIALNDLSSTQCDTETFYSKAINIYEMFIRSDGLRHCKLQFANREALAKRFEVLRLEESDSFPHEFYRMTRKKASMLRVMLGFDGQEYKEWTTETQLNPEIFRDFGFALFLVIYREFSRDEADFINSPEYSEYCSAIALEEVRRQEDLYSDFKEARMRMIRAWARTFKAHENTLRDKAWQATNRVEDAEVDRIVELALRQEIKRRAVQIRLVEQCIHEEKALLADEAVGWVEENTLDFIFDFYVRSLLTAMWAVPAFQQGMLEYSGYLKLNMKRKKREAATAAAVAAKAKKDSGNKDAQSEKEWFDQFLTDTCNEEKKLAPLDKAMACIVIQRRFRGTLGRSRARPIFAKTYKKYYSEEERAYYYYNTVTLEVSWYRPKIFSHLYPKAANW